MTRYIFLHQVKTGGKTVEKFLLRKFKEDFLKTTILFPDESLNNIFDTLSTSDSHKIKQMNGAKVVSGHFPFGIHNLLDGDSQYFTILRDPIFRIRSYYTYSLNSKGSRIYSFLTENNVTFDQFVQMEKSDIDRSGVHELNYVLEDGQAKLLAGADISIGQNYGSPLLEEAKNNIRKHFGFIGVTELFDDSFIQISRLLGYGSFSLYTTQNQTNIEVDMNENVKSIIHERNSADQILHKEAYDNVYSNRNSLLNGFARTYLKYGSSLADTYVKLRM